MDLTILENHEIQSAVQRNLVSFPSQAPVFPRQSRPEIQWKMAVLYFLRRWSLSDIARRYGLSRERAGQIVKAWRVLSVEQGYIQEIPEDPFSFSRPATPYHPAAMAPERAQRMSA
jgi:hypothetical protein